MKKFILIFLSLTLFGGLATGGYLLISNQIITLPFLEKKPEEAVKLMIEKMKNIKTFEYNTESSVQIWFDPGKLKNNPLSFLNQKPKILGESTSLEKIGQENKITTELPFFNKSGPINFNLNCKLTGKIDQSKKIKPDGETKANLELDLGGMKMNVKGEFKNIDQITYFKLEQLPFPWSLFLGAEFYNQWFSLNSNEVGEKIKESDKNFSIFELGGNQEKIKKIREKINELIKNNPLIQVDERLKDEKIDEKKCYHYKISLDKNNLDKIVLEFLKIVADENMFGEKESPAFKEKMYDSILEYSEFKDFVNNIAKMIKKSEGELWIDKKDFYLRKNTFDINLDFSEAEFNKQKIPTGTFTANISGVVNYSNFNEPIKIEVPQNAKSILQMIDEAKKKAQAAKIISDIKQISVGLEMVMLDNGSYPLPPSGGNRLGIDATCLDNQGFKNQSQKCNNHAYFYSLPKHPQSPAQDYLYYLCDKDNYIIEFDLTANNGDLKAGKNYYTSKGDFKDTANIADDCLDLDKDGLPNYLEKLYKTNPSIADSDGDKYLDGEEIINGYNPNGKGKLKTTN